MQVEKRGQIEVQWRVILQGREGFHEVHTPQTLRRHRHTRPRFLCRVPPTNASATRVTATAAAKTMPHLLLCPCFPSVCPISTCTQTLIITTIITMVTTLALGILWACLLCQKAETAPSPLMTKTITSLAEASIPTLILIHSWTV